MNPRVFKLLIAAVVLLGALSLRAVEINVFAASSLTESLKEIATDYQKQTGDEIICCFDASSRLAEQIAQGAPVDIFFSADEAKMDDLVQRELIVTKTRQSMLSNSLAIVVSSNSPITIRNAADLTNAAVKRIALGDPKGVPVGVYSKEYLTKKGLWPAVEVKMLPTQNVRAALLAVEKGDADAGIVYKTDAAISKGVKVAYEIPANETPVISYPVALVKNAPQSGAAKKFLKYLESDEAASVFRKFGFIVRE